MVVFFTVAVEVTFGATGLTKGHTFGTDNTFGACVTVAVGVTSTTSLALAARANARLTLEATATGLAIFAGTSGGAFGAGLADPSLTAKARLTSP